MLCAVWHASSNNYFVASQGSNKVAAHLCQCFNSRLDTFQTFARAGWLPTDAAIMLQRLLHMSDLSMNDMCLGTGGGLAGCQSASVPECLCKGGGRNCRAVMSHTLAGSLHTRGLAGILSHAAQQQHAALAVV